VLPRALEPSQVDRQTLVTIDDFRDWLGELTLRPESESLDKRKIAWSYELTYDFQGAARLNPTEELQLHVHSERTTHPNAAAALQNTNTYWRRLAAGLERSGATVQRVEPTMDWGDGADWFVIERDGQQIGNGFVGHSGTLASFVLISGIYSSDPALFERTLAPKLRALASYEPLAAGAAANTTPLGR